MSESDGKIGQRILDLERRVSALENQILNQNVDSSQIDHRKEKRQSVKEFLNARSPKSVRDVTLLIAYFLEHFDGLVPFSAKELEQGFRAAKIPPPKNINDMVNKNIQRGFLMESASGKDNRKAWELTATGERVVEGVLQKE